jgi:hypothetical protein
VKFDVDAFERELDEAEEDWLKRRIQGSS